MEFEKIKNRFVLKPEERVIELLKKYKRMTITSLYNLARIQYDVLKNILNKLDERGKITQISQSITNDENKDIVFSKEVIWKGKK